MKILSGDQVLLEQVLLANNFWSRLTGYMFRRKPHALGILFEASGSMQTTFMFFNLDIFFIDQNNTVQKALRNVRPWRFTRIYPKTKKILEIPSGESSQKINEGSKLTFVNN